MKKLTTIILLSSVVSTSAFAGVYVENREAYNLASDQMEVMLRVGYNSDMGAGIMLTNTYTMQRKDELKHGYNEIEGWYPLFKPTDKLTIQPGGLINDKSIGSGGAVYLDVNYKFTPWFNLTVRNRYNHNNYSSTDLMVIWIIMTPMKSVTTGTLPLPINSPTPLNRTILCASMTSIAAMEKIITGKLLIPLSIVLMNTGCPIWNYAG